MSGRKPTARTDLWPEALIERCRKLWLDGNSASLCAEALGGGLTRSAIIGKMNRMGFKRGAVSSPSKFHPYPKRISAPPIARKHGSGNSFGSRESLFIGHRKAPMPANALADLLASGVESLSPKVWTERAFSECAYPVDGEGADTRSCCNPTEGLTYCPGHAALMFNGCPKVNTSFAESKPKRAQGFKAWAA